MLVSQSVNCVALLKNNLNDPNENDPNDSNDPNDPNDQNDPNDWMTESFADD